ncbi:MAG: NAD(P)H-dependent oxidoreductase [Paracoccus denitrificans]|uniref:NAD(P)H-dependent oxidoreductase n=1 Tax=Paracoccus denitrificans TaxID=266 RepID=A0A533I5J3_PARDE|nr:MAG: NAD(P)H-dependent oxidoreductase [Paracoccus denitrificans]
MATILGLSGSLRKASFNAGLLRAARDLAPEGTTIEIGDIRQVPLYNADEETAHGLPASVKALQDALASCDGLLMVTPEYNNGVPGVFKNVIDWMSRGPGLAEFVGKPVLLIGASPGGFGTILAQNGWLPILRTLKADLWAEGRMMVSRASGLFDSDGNLTDEKTRETLAGLVADYSAHLSQPRG